MNLRSGFAKFTGKSAYWFLHTFLHGGSSLPGKIATQIDPKVLQHLAKNYDVIIISGTNGKTMTTALTVAALKKKYHDVLTNPSGSNMLQGIVTAFLAHPKAKSTNKHLAVLEVDEANVEAVTRLTQPKSFVLTNIFRDQMDRYGEIYTTYSKILAGIKLAPEATVIANGDASIFASRNLPNPTVYYGFNTQKNAFLQDFKAPVNTDGVLCPVCDHILHYHELSYANLGSYFCPNCGFKRPALKYQVTELTKATPNQIDFKIDNQPFQLKIGGTYNVYNALAAYTTAQEFGVDTDQIAASFSENERLFGRQELISYADKTINLILVKNPVGLNEVLSMLNTEKDPYSLVFLLNANYADGIDTSWIWDGNFEQLDHANIKQVAVGGERRHDIGFRLEVAGFAAGKMKVAAATDNLFDILANVPTKKVYILATYTAMLELRKKMAERKIISAGM